MAIPLVAKQEWVWLGLLAAVTLVIFAVYLQPWHIPIKYLLPGDDLPDRLPGAPGGCDTRHFVHELR